METIELYSVVNETPDKELISTIVSRMIDCGYVPFNGLPRTVRAVRPYLTLKFIACSDVPNK